ncbi:DUF805 domain-containing protein [Sphingorhabdus sp. Alg231-15]|uniref:DUF805 domain-containing protein n=1 Tax=Sphingorhabdus sp. Alg231-15 TaxID=1922222 RepID=UPI000D54BDEA
MEWMLMPLKRYAEFSGRSRRKEYWMFFLLNMIVLFGLAIVGGILGAFTPSATGEMGLGSGLILGLFGLYALAIFIPSLAVQVRRFHDQDKSGWFVLLGFIPYVGGIVVLVFMCLEGTKGKNRFGDDPKMSDNVGDVFN